MVNESHRRLVSSLYRQSLRISKSWINRRDLWREKAVQIRKQFDDYKDVTDPRTIHYLVAKTEAMLKKYEHPDPIIPPLRPGGTKYERNVAAPTGESKLSFFQYF